MCRIIGITGARGSGRKTAAWLLAKTMEEQRKGTTESQYHELFRQWVDMIIADENVAHSTNHVVLDSFGEHILDQLKQFCPVLIPYDLHNELVIKSAFICPVTFRISDNPKHKTTAATYYNMIQDDMSDLCDVYMTLEEFIIYFAHYVIKSAFGEDVWLHVATSTADAMGSDDSRIYWDCKTQAELDYISSSGHLILIKNSDREREGGYRDIRDLRPHFTIDTTEGLHNSSSIFWNIITEIRKNG